MKKTPLHILIFALLVTSACGQDLSTVSPTLQLDLPDEQPVTLSEVHIKSEITGNLALTTSELIFHNPNDRVLEGTLTFPLLEGQAVVRFAMDIDGALREAVPVDKKRGQYAFEEIVRREVDPGLLEKVEGNNYRCRIYPIPANGYKRVIIAVMEELALSDDGFTYRLPLAYNQKLDKFSIQILVPGPERSPMIQTNNIEGLILGSWQKGWQSSAEKTDFVAEGLLEIGIPLAAKPQVFTQQLEDETYFYAPLRIDRQEKRERPAPRTIALIWDSSGSGANRRLAEEFSFLDLFFKKYPTLEVQLIRLRNRMDEPQKFNVSRGDWQELREELEQTIYDGGTFLGDISSIKDVDQCLLFTDGLNNFGPVSSLNPNVPVFVVQSAVSKNATPLRQLAENSGGTFIDLTSTRAAKAVEFATLETSRIVDVIYPPGEIAHVFPEASVPAYGWIGVAGILLADHGKVELKIRHPGGRIETVPLKVEKGKNPGSLAARAWASRKINTLEANYEVNRNDIQRTARKFGIVTRDTSLIILESVNDYVTYDIVPPPELYEEYLALKQDYDMEEKEYEEDHWDEVLEVFAKKKTWYEKEYPKDFPQKTEKSPEPEPATPPQPADTIQSEIMPLSIRGLEPGANTPQTGLEPVEQVMTATGVSDDDVVELEEFSIEGINTSLFKVHLQPFDPEAGYHDRYKRVTDERLYAVYLEERSNYPNSTAFYLDSFHVLEERGQHQLALRVLSNLAEMELENHQILRILAYRLLQAGYNDTAIYFFRRVMQIRSEEPQSYRDLALALHAAGEDEEAVSLLWQAVSTPWDDRFFGIELIALAEMNAIMATTSQKLDLPAIDPSLLYNMPLDLRAILTWDADYTDIDLWVTDPYGEKCFFSNPFTRIGGRLNNDMTDGYGPEEFSLRDAVPGTYTVEAEYYGDNMQVISGEVTLQLNLQTRFGTPFQEEQRVTLRLKNVDDVVLVGKFEIGAQPTPESTAE